MEKSLSNPEKETRISLLIFLIIFVIGTILRIVNNLNNSGFWMDEARLALNIIDKSYTQLLQPLDMNQIAPILFLWIEKTLVNFLGNSERSFRLFPLICSILSLPLFFATAKKLFQEEKIALMAFFIFATSTIHIRYAAEMKQYATDVLMTLLLIFLFLRVKQYAENPKSFLLFILSGIIAIFLSNVAVIILFSISVYWMISGFIAKKTDRMKCLTILIWGMSFILYYFLFIANNEIREYTAQYWKDSFPPLMPVQKEFWHFVEINGRKVFFELILYNFAGLSRSWNLILFYSLLMIYFLGIIFMTIRRNFGLLFFVTFPLLTQWFIAGFKLYPFDTRLMLYLSPFLFMTLSYGLFYLGHYIQNYLKTRKFSWIIPVIVLLIFPYKLLYNFPIRVDNAKESIEFINKNFREGQSVYVYYYSLDTVKYYKRLNKVKFDKAIIKGAGEGDLVNWKADLENLEKIRGEVWLLFSHLFKTNNYHPENILLNSLLKRGILLKSFQTKNSSAYLLLLK